MSVTRYLVRNSTLRLVSFGVGIAFSLVITPVIVGAIGKAAYGFWALISATVANYLLLDFGLSQAISKFVAAAKAREDQAEIDRICSSGVALNFVSSVLSLLVTFVLVFPGRASLPPEVNSGQALSSFLLYAVTFSLLYLFRTWNGVLAAEMRWTLLAVIGMVRSVCVSLTVLIWINRENGLLLMAGVNGAGFLSEGVAYWYFATRRFSVRIRYANVDFGMCRELLKFGLTSLVAQLGQAMRFRSQPFILITLIGAQGVAVFSIASQFISYFHNLILSAFGVFIPLFSSLQAQGDSAGIRNSIMGALWLSCRVSSYVGLCLVFYGSDFVGLWLGPGFDDVRFALVPMALGAIFSTSMMPIQEYLMGVAKHKVTATCNLGEGFSVVAASLVAAPLWGIAGVGWAFFACSFVFRACMLPYFAFREASVPICRYMALIGRTLVTHVAPQCIAWGVMHGYFKTSYLNLLLMAGIQGAVTFVLQYGIFRLDRRILGLYG